MTVDHKEIYRYLKHVVFPSDCKEYEHARRIHEAVYEEAFNLTRDQWLRRKWKTYDEKPANKITQIDYTGILEQILEEERNERKKRRTVYEEGSRKT